MFLSPLDLAVSLAKFLVTSLHFTKPLHCRAVLSWLWFLLRKMTAANEIPVENQSKFELFLMMMHLGWDLDELTKSHFYSRSSPKVFCVTSTTTFFREYLLALIFADQVLSDNIDNGGLQRIYHGQSKAYYSAILCLSQLGDQERLGQLLPNKSAESYKVLAECAKKGKTAAVRSDFGPGSGNILISEMEDEDSFVGGHKQQGDSSGPPKQRRKLERKPKKRKVACLIWFK